MEKTRREMNSVERAVFGKIPFLSLLFSFILLLKKYIFECLLYLKP